MSTEQSIDDLHGDVDRVVLYRHDNLWRWIFRTANDAEILAESRPTGYVDFLVAWDDAERVVARLLVQHRQPLAPNEIQAVVWR